MTSVLGPWGAARAEEPQSWDQDPMRRGRDVAVVAAAGIGRRDRPVPDRVAAGPVLAASCREGSLESVGSCLVGGVRSFALATILVVALACVALRVAGVRRALALGILV